jgi:hypothetical protein
VPLREPDRQPDFARQLEDLATAVTLSNKVVALEGQFAAGRASEKAFWQRARQRWLLAKRVSMAAAFAVAFLQYYFLDVSVQIIAMRPVALAHAGTSAPHPFLRTPG